MAEAERLTLLDGHEAGGRGHAPELFEEIGLATRFQERFQLGVGGEVIVDDAFSLCGHEHDVVDTGRQGLFDAVLDDRLVDERQHLFRLRLGSGQEAGAEAGGGKDGFADRLRHGDPSAGIVPYVLLLG